jgi:hypothetical protein
MLKAISGLEFNYHKTSHTAITKKDAFMPKSEKFWKLWVAHHPSSPRKLICAKALQLQSGNVVKQNGFMETRCRMSSFHHVRGPITTYPIAAEAIQVSVRSSLPWTVYNSFTMLRKTARPLATCRVGRSRTFDCMKCRYKLRDFPHHLLRNLSKIIFLVSVPVIFNSS